MVEIKRRLIGKRLKLLRKGHGLTQGQLADLLKITRPLISMYESGERLPSPKIMEKYSKIFKKSVDEIFF